MTLKQSITYLAIGAMTFSPNLLAQEMNKQTMPNDLVAFAWGRSQDEFMSSTQDKYDITNVKSESGASFYLNQRPIMIDNLRFKQIVKFKHSKTLAQVSYMNIDNSQTLGLSCSKIHDYLEKTFSKASYQALNNGPIVAFYVWKDLQGTTLYEFCFSESQLQTVILTATPKWKIISCKSDDKSHSFNYFFDDMNNEVREYKENYISSILKSTINHQKIDLATEKAEDHILIDRHNMNFILQSKAEPVIKGHCDITN